jgi:predicted lipase
MTRIFLTIILVTTFAASSAQQYIHAGFEGDEYSEMLRIVLQTHADSVHTSSKVPLPYNYKMIYRSPVGELNNRWDLWLRTDSKVAVISLRGTVAKPSSWLENFYMAMVPATGKLELNDSTVFNYKLAENPAAAVHVGWLTGLATMAPSIKEQVNEMYKKGVKEFVIMGHSQGGAIAFLVTSYLHYEMLMGNYPQDIHFKTYCSAAPKPGNLYYVYDYDFITRNGWSFTVVNSLDWVPETPISIQTVRDFNGTNPFVNVKSSLKKQKTLIRWYLNGVYNSLDKTTTKAQRKFEKKLGKNMFKQVKKYMPQMKEPAYVSSSNYMRAGVPIVLMADEEYKKQYPEVSKNIFAHHALNPYYMLTQKWYGDTAIIH